MDLDRLLRVQQRFADVTRQRDKARIEFNRNLANWDYVRGIWTADGFATDPPAPAPADAEEQTAEHVSRSRPSSE